MEERTEEIDEATAGIKVGRALKVPCWGLLCALLFLPPLFYGGVLPEMKWGAQAASFLLVFFILLRVLLLKRGWTSTPFDAAALMYLLVLTVSMSFSLHELTSVNAFFAYMAPLLLFVGMTQVIHRRGRALKVVGAILIFGFVLSIFGLLQMAGLFPHSWWSMPGNIASTYVNKNHFGGFLLMVIPLALGQVFYAERPSARVPPLLFAVTMIVTLVLTRSSGALLAFSLSLVIFFYLLLYPKKIPRIPLVILFLLCLGFGLFIFNRLATFFQAPPAARLGVLASELNSWDARISVWKSTLQMIRDHPLAGVGPGNFEAAFPPYRQPRMDKLVDYAHNDFLQYVAEVGVFGILVLFFATYRLFRETIRRLENHEYPRAYRGVVLGAFTGLMALWFHSLLDFNLQIPANALIAAFLVSLISLDFYAHRNQS